MNDNDIVVVGAPLDCNSSYQKGPALAPAKIIEGFYCKSSNMWTENLIDLETSPGWRIKGDIKIFDEKKAFSQIESEIEMLLKTQSRVITLGGDHSITLPVVRAYSKVYKKLNILHFDAHPDLYHQLDGNRYSHACPFARIMEENLAVRLVQVGIRTMTGHQREQADRFGVEVIEMKNITAAKKISFNGPVYLSLDLDCLDPAYAPGVSHHEPGGMTTRDVLEILHNLKGNLVGADIVEYNPARDINGMTGMVAGKFLKELIGRMLRG
ncbi:agmatinase [Desulfosediminicola flagellatus]|uniref:agmatinase n=1 Tax=Desulfosediminicola flagellatus TaxID=2569541 RepID=UPI0010AD4672|nr:agmatinase [Desulfosediminicola flagellatus]